MKSSTPKITILYQNNQNGFMGVSQCPGKNFTSKNGLQRNNNLKKDLQRFKEQGVKVIVNLLNLYDLRIIGVNLKKYQTLCDELQIQLINLPIIEMSVPEISIEQVQIFTQNLIEYINKGEGVVIHCRGGVGRAGLMAGILLGELKNFQDKKDILIVQKV